MAQVSADALERAARLRLMVFDVDGVLTDGRIYIGEHGETVKAFSTLDGHGLKLLAQAGIVPIVVTGRDSPAVRRRVADLRLAHAVYGAHDKLAAAAGQLDQRGRWTSGGRRRIPLFPRDGVHRSLGGDQGTGRHPLRRP